MKELQERLKAKTEEFMKTCCKQSHKRTRLFLEMQELNRQIKKAASWENAVFI